jgi:DNA-binding NtrC family response regulator
MLLAKAKAAIVEHDESMISLYRAALALAGYALVGVAQEATSALKIVQEERPDLLLVDYRLVGNRDGLDFIQEAKALAPEVFTILVTAVSFIDIVEKIRLVQPDRTLQKPFMLRSLLDLLRTQEGHTPLSSGTL